MTLSLEERFLEPPGWRWQTFTRQGRTIRFGSVLPTAPDAIVVCLPGLSEFAEKYFETARDCVNHNLAFFVIDWMGQGKSSRYIANSQKRHSHGYQQDIDDLHELVTKYAQQSGLPLVMLAHSMGGHIGLRYLAQHPGVFKCAAFSAPMLGVKALENIPAPLAEVITGFTNLLGSSYIHGFGDWRESVRSDPAINFYSEDKARNAIHNAWCLADPALQVGGITYGWLHETRKSCAALWKKGVLESIRIPCLMALAGHEHFVSNAAIRKAAKTMPDVRLIEFPDSLHEILVEREEIRKVFMEAFYKLIKEQKQG